MLLNVIITVIALLVTYVNIRNYMVHSTILDWNSKCHYKCVKYIKSKDYDETVAAHYHEMWEDITNISYESMLYSFKPLTMEYWLTKEQIEFLTNE